MNPDANDPSDLEDAIFETALHLEDPGQRRRFLEQTLHGDPEALQRVSELLEVAGESAAFFIETRRHRDLLAQDTLDELLQEELRREALTADAETEAGEEEPDSLIGRYRRLRRIGAGGCGVVYEAEQEEPVKRRVALKVIRLGMDTEAVIARFEVERQALALMDHPHIARVLDAGATAGGRPYFVMELVRGDRITAWCDAEKLGLRERLGLFIQVCHAIQHAHQKGIIHRDIKPSNILVGLHDGIALPKIIDFGIAKATQGRPRGRSLSTALDQPVGTPAYMSPEQVDMGGIDTDTRADVYSLGALLYELLTGRPPFEGEALLRAGMSEMRRILLEKDPPLPSAVLAAAPEQEALEIAARRRCDRGRLRSLLAGDLDGIVMKALEKDRNRRYQTANSLAMDVRRFLADEPVIARRPGRLYLVQKFIRRNRATCLAAAAVAISLLGGMSVATVLYLRERAALVEQERLRQEAEGARREEVRLRGQAQARANVSRAAVLLSEGQIAEADALLQQTPLSSIDPSVEAAGVFRSLGNWNAAYGRWEQAVQCFTLFNQANRFASRSLLLEDLDVLYAAPAYLENGDPVAYESYRRSLLDLYLPALNSLEAEHLLKACLLLPADAGILERLKATAEVCAEARPPRTGWRHFPEWEAFSLALYHYRLGDAEAALQWCGTSQRYEDPAGSRLASLLCLTALSYQRLGRREEAMEELWKARHLIPLSPRAASPAEPPRQLPGTWLSWAVARILLREADAALASPAPSAPSVSPVPAVPSPAGSRTGSHSPQPAVPPP